MGRRTISEKEAPMSEMLGILYERVRSVGYDDGRAVAQPSRNVWLGVGDGDNQSLRQTLCRLYEAAPVDKGGRSCPVTDDAARACQGVGHPYRLKCASSFLRRAEKSMSTITDGRRNNRTTAKAAGS
jgi:hypothetical protein